MLKKLLVIAVSVSIIVVSSMGFTNTNSVVTVSAVIGTIDTYRTRSELLMEATNYTGVFTPEEAATVWAEGLYRRSAALQYTVMTEKLKKQYAEKLDKWGSNWVTGQSSPSVMSFMITSVEKTDKTHSKVNLKFEVGSPSTSSKYYDAILWLVREGEFWRVEKIWTDQALNVFTFLT